MPLMTIGVAIFAALLLLGGSWWWLNNTFAGKLFWYRLYKVGALAKTPVTQPDGWTTSELTLGKDFAKFIPAMDKGQFDNFREYLSKAGDIGRTPVPLWLVFVLIILVAAEGMGFSYLLGTWIAMEGSSNLYTVLMLAIVFVLCTVLVFVTHAAGHQLHRTRLINQCRRTWQESSNQGSFKTREMSLFKPQALDDSDPECTQTVNRVGDRGSYAMVGIAVVTIAAIAVLSTWMRMQALERSEAEETMGKTQSSAVARDQPSGNPFATGGSTAGASKDGLPSEITDSNNKAKALGEATIASARHGEGMAAFLTLAVIFIITQIVGIYAGFKWGFAGKESKQAYSGTGGFSNWAQVQQVREQFIQPVEELMGSLHEKFRGTNKKIAGHSFKQFLARQQAESDSLLPQSTQSPPMPPAAQSVSAAPPRSPQGPLTTEQALAQFDELSDKDAREAYVLSLPGDLQNKLAQALRERKSTAAKAQFQGLLD